MAKKLFKRLMTKVPFGHGDTKKDDLQIVDGKIVEIIESPISEPEILEIQFENEIIEFTPEDITSLNHLDYGLLETPAPQAKAPQVVTLEDMPGAFLMEETTVIPDKQGFAGFFLHLEAKNRAARTIKEYGYDLKWWDGIASTGSKTVTALTMAEVEKAISKLKGATARRKVSALRSYAKWELREGNSQLFTELCKVEAPTIPKRLPKDLGAVKFKELAARAKDLTSENDRRGIWLGLMLCGGLRISEIREAKKVSGMLKVIGKGDKERVVPVPEWVRVGMTKIKGEGPGGWRQQKQTIWNQLDKIGIRKPHSLRHTYASELLRKGFPLQEIQVLLGHSKIDTTTVYTNTQIPSGVVEALEVQ